MLELQQVGGDHERENDANIVHHHSLCNTNNKLQWGPEIWWALSGKSFLHTVWFVCLANSRKTFILKKCFTLKWSPSMPICIFSKFYHAQEVVHHPEVKFLRALIVNYLQVVACWLQVQWHTFPFTLLVPPPTSSMVQFPFALLVTTWANPWGSLCSCLHSATQLPLLALFYRCLFATINEAFSFTVLVLSGHKVHWHLLHVPW